MTAEYSLKASRAGDRAKPLSQRSTYSVDFVCRLALPTPVKHWSQTTLGKKMIKIGAKVVRHSKHVAFQLAKVAVPRESFAAILDRIQRFGVPPPLVRRG